MSDVATDLNLTECERHRLRYNALVKKRDPFLSDWKEIAKYVDPRRELMDVDFEQGETVGKYIYDISPIIYSNELVNGFQGNIVTPSILWFDLKFTNPELRDIPEAQQWLEDWVRYLYRVFENTKFYNAIHEYIKDCIHFATSTITVEDDIGKQCINYRTRHPMETVIAENRQGDVDTAYRKYKLSATAAFKAWGEKLSDKIRNAARNSSTMYDEFEFIFGAFPNSNHDSTKDGVQFKKFKLITFEAESKGPDEEPLEVSGDSDLPDIVWRFDKNSNEWYGRGLFHDGLRLIKSLNAKGKDLGKASHLAVSPAWYAPESHRGRLRVTPDTFNYYTKYAEEKIESIHKDIKYPVGLDRVQDERHQLRELLMVDYFLTLHEVAKDVKTATHAVELKGEQSIMLGTSVGRFESEGLDPLLNRTFRIEYEAGRGPEVPEVLHDYGGDTIQIDYIGPLSQQQRRLFKSRGIMHSLNALYGVMGMYPPAADKVDFDFVTEEILEGYGMPQKGIRGDEEVYKIRAAKAQRAEEERKIMLTKELADAFPKLAKKVESGSVIEQAQQAASGGVGG
ncbi:MAG: head-tail connector protein [Spirochaetes bacterium]|nr:head-tail connector protein [Spirochaetota bacterium]